MKGKEYKLAIRIAGTIDKSFSTSLVAAKSTLRKTVTEVNGDFARLDKGFNKTMGFGSKAFHTIATAATVAATAIGAATAAAINIGMEFEKQMSAVQAISGATAEEMTQLEDKARELGQTSVFSATEVGKAMEYMGMAGWKTEQILAGIEGVMNLAAASGEELSTVSDIVTDDLTAFHMEAGETARMVDVMAQAAMNSNTNVEKMGETFKYAGTVAGAMGYQIEDIAIATGLMASSGIKASNAGTALRNIITRMAKPTKESAEAMEALGLSLEKDDGTMYSFLEIMEQMRKGMSGMTEMQKAYYGAELGGQRGMPGLLAIANSTDKQFKELTEAIYNAEGAAQRMADIRLDNLAGDVQIFKDTLSDAGIELSQELNGPLREIVQLGTGFISSAATQIPRMINKIGVEFPTLQRKFKKFAKPVLSGIVNGGKWIIKNGDSIISVLAGIGAAMAAYKAASTITHIVNAIMTLGSLNPVTLGILGVVEAIGLLVTAFVSYKQYEQELIDQSIANHFGNITLSMEELQQVAEYIVSSESLGGVKKALDAFKDLDGISATMQDAVSELDKLNWKISIGMELTEDENESYKQAIDDYIKAAQDYAIQSQYAVSLNITASFAGTDLEGSDIVDKINAFYRDKYDELSALGTELNEAVTEAFNDGLLEIDEANKIAEIQRQMANIKEQLATGELQAELSLIGSKYSGVSLDADSFKNLQEELAEKTREAQEAYDEAYVKNVSAAQASLSGEDLDSALKALEENRTNQVADLQAQSLGFQLNTIMSAYADEMQEFRSTVESVMDTWTSEEFAQGWEESPVVMIDSIFRDISEKTDKTTALAVAELLESMEPSLEQAEELKAKYRELGLEIPEELNKALADAEMLGGMTVYEKLFGRGGNENDLYQVIYQQFSNEEELAGLKEKLEENGWEFPEAVQTGITDGVEEAKENLLPVIEGMYAWSDDTINEYFARGFDVDSAVRINLNPVYNNFPNTRIPLLEDRALSSFNSEINKLPGHADGGIFTTPHIARFAEKGPESAIPLDGSRNAISLWEKTGQFLGMRSAFDGLDLNGGNEVNVEYNPQLYFYGEAPGRDDITDALDISQDKFDSMMDRYFKTHSRVSFG